MSSRDFILGLGDYFVAYAAIPTAIFVLSYGVIRPFRKIHGARVEPWWRSVEGTMMFLLGLSLLAVQGIVVASLFLGVEYPGREWVRLFGYGMIAVSSTWMMIVYYRISKPRIPAGEKAEA